MRKRRRYIRRRVTVLVLIPLCLFAFLTVQYRPLMLDSACNLARGTAIEIIHQTVCDMLSQEDVRYEDLIDVTYNEQGDIRTLQANAARINRVKSETVLAIKHAFQDQEVQTVSVPIGTLCGFTMLSARGPAIPCRSLLLALPSAEFSYHFDGAGINQTLHSIIMTVTVPMSVTLPLQDRDFEIKASFLIGETILVGEVPDSYTNVISDPEVADDIFNYGDLE